MISYKLFSGFKRLPHRSCVKGTQYYTGTLGRERWWHVKGDGSGSVQRQARERLTEDS